MTTMTFVYEDGAEVKTITVSSLTIGECFAKVEIKIPEGSKIVNWY